MTLDTLFSIFNEHSTSYQTTVPNSWSQGRTIYGGLSAAFAYQAAENLLEDERPVRSFHCNFIGPLNCDQPIEIQAEMLRTGKNVTQVLAKVMQNGQVGTMAQVCFGVNRQSKLEKPLSQQHSMLPPTKTTFIPQIPKIVPKFVQHFDYRLEKGHLAFKKSEEPVIHGWNRLTKAPAKMNMAYLILMMDAWPPSMFQLLRLPVAASTMSWNLEFINPHVELSPEQWLASETFAHHIKDGYGHEEAKFWSDQGDLLAISKQVVAVFT